MTREEGLKRLREARDKLDRERETLRKRAALLQGVELTLAMGSITPDQAMEQAGIEVPHIPTSEEIGKAVAERRVGQFKTLADLCAGAQKEAAHG